MKIKESRKAPVFKLDSTDGGEFNLKKKNKKIIVFFYPKDDTPGCTLETRDFSKLYKKFKRKKCEIIGISKDSIESHLKFKRKIGFPLNCCLMIKRKFKNFTVFGV